MGLTVQAGEYRSVVGLKDLYVCEVTQDDSGGYVADTPEYLAPAAAASQKPTVNSKTQFADDGPYDAMTAEGETVLEIEITGLPIEMLAKITGKVFDTVSGRMFDNGGTPPYCALLFKSKKSNGSYRYYSYLKGRFSTPEEEATTQTDTPDPKTVKLIFTAIKTVFAFDLGSINDGVKRVVGDEDTTNFDGASWYTQVQTPDAVAPSALSLSSSSPTGGATGVSISAVLTLTFNNALALGEELDAVLINSSTGAVVAGTNTINAARKIVTVGHSSTLAASTLHRIVYTVKDIYGQTLTGVVSFTTA